MLSTIFVTETVIENRSKGDDFRGGIFPTWKNFLRNS